MPQKICIEVESKIAITKLLNIKAKESPKCFFIKSFSSVKMIPNSCEKITSFYCILLPESFDLKALSSRI